MIVWTWTAALSKDSGTKSPPVGYAPSEYRTKPWPVEALIAGWFPLLCENSLASMSKVNWVINQYYR